MSSALSSENKREGEYEGRHLSIPSPPTHPGVIPSDPLVFALPLLLVLADRFEASDMAIECMHNQYLCNRQISVQYAYKKESRGERHGGQVIVVSNAEKVVFARVRDFSGVIQCFEKNHVLVLRLADYAKNPLRSLRMHSSLCFFSFWPWNVSIFHDLHALREFTPFLTRHARLNPSHRSRST